MASTTLMDITEEQDRIEKLLVELSEESGGEITEEIAELIAEAAAVEMERDQKLDNYIHMMRRIEAEKEILKERSKVLGARAKSREAIIQSMKSRILINMQLTGRKVIEGDLWTIKIQNNPAAPFIIDDIPIEEIPEQFVTRDPQLNTGYLKKFIKAGGETDFARFGERGQHIRIR